MSTVVPRVLVAEPSKTLAALIRASLSELHVEIELAAEGTSALAAARARPPSVLICDERSPGLDGYALAHAVRQINPQVQTLLLVSEHGRPDPERLAYVGVADVLTTPFERAVLIERVRSLLPQQPALEHSGPKSEVNRFTSDIGWTAGTPSLAPAPSRFPSAYEAQPKSEPYRGPRLSDPFSHHGADERLRELEALFEARVGRLEAQWQAKLASLEGQMAARLSALETQLGGRLAALEAQLDMRVSTHLNANLPSALRTHLMGELPSALQNALGQVLPNHVQNALNHQLPQEFSQLRSQLVMTLQQDLERQLQPKLERWLQHSLPNALQGPLQSEWAVLQGSLQSELQSLRKEQMHLRGQLTPNQHSMDERLSEARLSLSQDLQTQISSSKESLRRELTQQLAQSLTQQVHQLLDEQRSQLEARVPMVVRSQVERLQSELNQRLTSLQHQHLSQSSTPTPEIMAKLTQLEQTQATWAQQIQTQTLAFKPEQVSEALARASSEAVSRALGGELSQLVPSALEELKAQLEGELLTRLDRYARTELSEKLSAHAEQVVWKIVPNLAEDLIREEIRRLTAE